VDRDVPARFESRVGTDDDRDVAVTIDCDACTLKDSDACSGCLVSFVLDREPGDAVIFDAAEARAVRLLARGGLVPGSRFEAADAS
jgi:hypothetical protein